MSNLDLKHSWDLKEVAEYSVGSTLALPPVHRNKVDIEGKISVLGSL